MISNFDFSYIYGPILSKVNELLGKFEDVDTLTEDVQTRASEAYEFMYEQVSSIAGSASQMFTETFETVTEKFTETFELVFPKFKSFWGEVFEWWTAYDYSQMFNKNFAYWAYSIYQATWASIFRLNSAVFLCPGASKEKAPKKPIILYESEGDPYCKMVREAACVLALDVMFKPCPKEGTIFLEELKRRTGGKADIPYLVDENNQNYIEMSGYREIIKYLFDTYGEGLPARFTPNRMIPFRMMHNCPIYSNSVYVSSFIRGTIGYGRKALPSNRPEQALTLWGNEHSPFVTLVRELLCSFEIPYVLKNAPIGCDWKRDEFREKYGYLLSKARNMIPHMIQIPLLIDPNTKTTMTESRAICDYLWKTYSKDNKLKAA